MTPLGPVCRRHLAPSPRLPSPTRAGLSFWLPLACASLLGGRREEGEGGAEGGSRVAICGQRILFKRSSSRKEQTREAEGGEQTRPGSPQPRAAEHRGAGGGGRTAGGGRGDTQRRRRRRSGRWASRRSKRRRNRRASRGLRRAGRTAREEEAEEAEGEEEKGVRVEGGRGDALLWMLDFGILDSLADSPPLPRSGLGWPH